VAEIKDLTWDLIAKLPTGTVDLAYSSASRYGGRVDSRLSAR
jgi:hypothetical protein